MNIRKGTKKKHILLAAAILVTVLSLLFAVLAALAARSLRYAAMGILTGISVLSLWGMPILYYHSARLRLSDKLSAADAQDPPTACAEMGEVTKDVGATNNGEAENGEA